MSDATPGIHTLAVHAGVAPDPATGALQTPIYQTASYVFKDADHAARLFNLEEVGFIYSRLTNPTVSALQTRIAALEGGAGAVATSSGHAAQLLALFPLLEPGLNFVVSNKLYGGSANQFSQAFKRFGWQARFVDFEVAGAIEGAIDDDTRLIFCESLANPGGVVTDLKAVARIAEAHKIPLVVDNTLATPALCRPIEHGATLVVHSTTKFLTGNGTTIGGIVVDSGKFDWAGSGKFPALSEPSPSYHGLTFHPTLGAMAFTFYGIAIGLRDLGVSQAPQNAFQILLGTETLPLRMAKHSSNALAVAQWLEKRPEVEWVSYAGLASSPYRQRADEYLGGSGGAVFTFGLKGGFEAGKKFVNGLKLFSLVANLGDSRSLVAHPASTTHRQMTPEARAAAGAGDEVVRLSIGLEDLADIFADLDQALVAAAG